MIIEWKRQERLMINGIEYVREKENEEEKKDDLSLS